MPHHYLATCTNQHPDTPFEDADRALIETLFATMQDAGLPRDVVDGARQNITLYVCCSCGQHWMNNSQTHQLPSWYRTHYGRGRRVKTKDLENLFKNWHQGEIYCEQCGLAMAVNFAYWLVKGRPTEESPVNSPPVTIKVKKSYIRKFLRLYCDCVKGQKSGSRNFENSFAYRFHVKLATELFQLLPARQRTAFASMTELLGVLHIL